MPFCSSCGAEVKGAFCSACGASSAAAPGGMTPPAASQAPVAGGIVMPAPAARRKTSIVVWILCGFAGLILLGLIGTTAVAYWFVSNPGVALSKVLTAANPDLEVINVDNAGRRLTIRDRRDGKEVTVSYDDVKNGHISFSARDENGKVGQVDIGGGAGKLPSWVPVYPGAKVESHISGQGNDGDERSEGGVYQFTSGDSPSQVMSFYQDKARDLGMKVELTTATSEGGHFSAAEEDNNRSLVVLVGTKPGGGASGSVTFKRKQ
jgi:hypothetical protein